ncbi:MAG: hypothetical protein KF795_28480 [Labilithrix sp.]|nr:hypothetical protein [Labilithrix sp.]
MTSRNLALTLLAATTLVAGGAAADATAPKAEKFVIDLAGARIEADDVIVSASLGERDPLLNKPSGKQEEITLRGGAAMTRDTAKLLEEAFTKECARRVDGSFAFADKDYGELSRLTFAWGVVTEVALPSLDVKSKDAATTTLKLQPQFPKRIVQHGDKVARGASGPAWTRATFKLSVDGLDGALKSAQEVGEIRVAQTPSASAPVQCSAATVADLTFAIPTADAGALAAWKDGAARNGSVDYLAADGSSVVKVKLTGLKKKAQAVDGALTKVTASVGAVAFERGAAKAASAPKK